MPKKKFKYEYGIDERGRRHIIVKHKGRYLIFKHSSKLLKFLNEKNVSNKEFDRAINYVDRVFRKLEDKYIDRITERNAKREVRYIG